MQYSWVLHFHQNASLLSGLLLMQQPLSKYVYVFWSHYPQQRRVILICNLNATSWNRKLFGGGQRRQKNRYAHSQHDAKERPLFYWFNFAFVAGGPFDAESFVYVFMCNRIRNHRSALNSHAGRQTEYIIQCGIKVRAFLCVLEWAAKKTWQNVLLTAAATDWTDIEAG